MKACNKEYADLIVDGKPYRLETWKGFLRAKPLFGLKGIVFTHFRETAIRLRAEEAERKRQAKEERRRQAKQARISKG